MSNSSSSSSSGIGTLGLLGVAFVVLKLCGIINWSWWWILSPFWIPITLVVLGLLIYLAVLFIKEELKAAKYAKQRRLREEKEKLIEMNKQHELNEKLENRINQN